MYLKSIFLLGFSLYIVEKNRKSAHVVNVTYLSTAEIYLLLFVN